MTLPADQVEQFYRMWLPLLSYANDQLNVVSTLSSSGPKGGIDRNHAIKVRDAIWKNEKILAQFIANNPAQLSPEDLQILSSWKYRRKGTFIIYKVLKKQAIFISQAENADVFAVKGLASSFDQLFGEVLPIMVEAVLLPFNHEIITDGLYQSYSVTFGPGIRANLKAIYDDAKERDAVISSLLPSQNTLSKEDRIAKGEAINAKVLDAFLRYQYKTGLSPKTVERDATHVSSASKFWLTQQTEPTSLRDLGSDALRNFLSAMPEKERKPARLSLRRFIAFLQDTGRLDWDEAENLLEALKSEFF